MPARKQLERRRIAGIRPTAYTLALVLAGVVWSAAPTPTHAQDVLACVVASGGVPVVGATVVLAGTLHGSITDSTGCVRLQGVPAGRYTIVVQREGFVTREVGVTVVGATNTALDIKLSRPLPQSDQSQGSSDASGSAIRTPDVLVFDAYVPVTAVRRTGFFQDGTRRIVLPINARFAGLGSVDPAVLAHPFLPVSPRVHAQRGRSERGRRSANSELGLRPIGSVAVGSNVGAVRVGLGVERVAETSRFRVVAGNVSGRGLTDGSGTGADDKYVATSLSASVERGIGSYVVAARGEGVLVSKGDARGTYQPDQPAVADVSVDIRRPAGRGFNSVRVSSSIRRDGFNAVDSTGQVTHASEISSSGRRLNTIDVGALGLAERRMGDRGTIRGSIGASVVQLDSRERDNPGSGASGYPSSLTAVALEVGGGVELNRRGTGFEVAAGLVVENADASDSNGASLDRVTEILPSINAVVSRTRRFGSSDLTIRLDARYRKWAPDPVLRITTPTVFWAGQRQIVAAPGHPLNSLRSAVQRISVDLDRRGIVAGVALGHEWLLDVPALVPVDTTGGSGERFADNPTPPWEISSASGRHGFVSAFAEARVMGFFAIGLDAHLVRSWSDGNEDALLGTPSSAVRGFLQVSGASGYPYVRWTTTVRLARDRVGISRLEAQTPGSSDTNLEVGVRRGPVGVILGVANLGDRVVRDHATIRAAGESTPAYPGRRLYVGVRLE